MSETVLEWFDIRSGERIEHRIQITQKPGSAHWSITKDSRGAGGTWGRDWSYEANSRPEVLPNDE